MHANQREMIEKLKDRVEKIRGFLRYFEEEEDNPKIVINGKNGKIKYGVLIRRQEVQPKVKKNEFY